MIKGRVISFKTRRLLKHTHILERWFKTQFPMMYLLYARKQMLADTLSILLRTKGSGRFKSQMELKLIPGKPPSKKRVNTTETLLPHMYFENSTHRYSK